MKEYVVVCFPFHVLYDAWRFFITWKIFSFLLFDILQKDEFTVVCDVTFLRNVPDVVCVWLI